MVYEHIGDRIRYLRQCNEMTQSNLAKQLFISPNTLSQYENGRRSLTTDMLKKIAENFKVSTDYLMGITEEIYDIKDEMIVEMIKKYKGLEEMEKKEFIKYVKNFKGGNRICLIKKIK